MIVEHRTYTLFPGKIAAYFDAYAREGMATQQRHLGKMLGYYATEIGAVNEVIHMWAYADLGDREKRREALKADPLWQAYIAKILPFVERQESRILIPAPFFKLGGE